MTARRANLHEPVETETPEPVEEAAETPAEEPEETPEENETPDEPEAVTEESDETETAEPEGWYPGQPCLNCKARDYKWTTGWGARCSQCAPENQVEED